MNVDLPAPLGPVKPYLRPDKKAVDTSSNKILAPKRMETLLTVITGEYYFTLKSNYNGIQLKLHLALVLSTALAATAGHTLLKPISFTSGGDFDYLTVDSANRRLYVSHGMRVEVIDIDTGKTVGKVEKTEGVRGIAVVPNLNRGFTSNGAVDTVTIFDLKTLATLGTVNVGQNPGAILYEAYSKRVFTFNSGTINTTAIDAATGKVLGSMMLGGKPEGAAADGKGTIFVNIVDTNEVVAFDSKRLEILNRWPLTGCVNAVSMTLDEKNHRLFVGCHSRALIVVDSKNGHKLTTLPIGEQVGASAYDPATKLLYASNGDGTVTVIQQESSNKYSVVETVKTQWGAKMMAYDPKQRRLYLSSAEYDAAEPGKKAERGAVRPGTFKVLVVQQAP